MGRSRNLVAVGLLALGALTAPARADDAEWSGFACGWFATTDPTGQVSDDPNVYKGYIDAGPVYAHDLLDDGLDGAATITQHCWLQFEEPHPRHFHDLAAPVPSAHCDFTSVVNPAPGPLLLAYQACPIWYAVPPVANVYSCTWWEIEHDGRHEDWVWSWDGWPSDGGTPVRVTDASDLETLDCYIALS